MRIKTRREKGKKIKGRKNYNKKREIKSKKRLDFKNSLTINLLPFKAVAQ